MNSSNNTPIIFFDGYCALCNKSVSWVFKKDKKKVFKYAPLDGNTAKNLIDLNLGIPDSIILWTGTTIKTKSSAALLIAKKLPYPWKLLYSFIIIPRFIRDYIYDLIARNRYSWFGKYDTCRIPSESEKIYFLN